VVDSLVHIGGGGGEGGFATRAPAVQAADALAAGVTTLIGALGTDDITRSHADLLACARALRADGLSSFVLTGSYQVPPVTVTGSVRGDLTLLTDVIGVGEIAIADHRGSQPTAAELARVAADARVGGLLGGKRGTVLVHVGDEPDGIALLRDASARFPVPVSQWHPTHMNRQRRVLSEALAWLGEGGSIDLTASTTPALLAAGDVDPAEALAEIWRTRGDLHGVTLSSDGHASLPHFDAEGRLLDLQWAPLSSPLDAARRAHRELGLPWPAVLATLTAQPAAIWGLAAKGRIVVGGDADLLWLDATTLGLRGTCAGGRWAAA
jgi:beta-aspartyl-dipeptidase (metallo-type)